MSRSSPSKSKLNFRRWKPGQFSRFSRAHPSPKAQEVVLRKHVHLRSLTVVTPISWDVDMGWGVAMVTEGYCIWLLYTWFHVVIYTYMVIYMGIVYISIWNCTLSP
jgi:hypothetical protein